MRFKLVKMCKVLGTVQCILSALFVPGTAQTSPSTFQSRHSQLAHFIDKELRLRETKETRTMVMTTLTAAKQLYIC